MYAVKLDHVVYTYPGESIHVLDDVTREFQPGEICAIVGKSGSGKTTMLSLLAGLDLPTSGDVLLPSDGGPVSTRTFDRDLLRRTRVSMIYQSFRLFPLLTALENVMFPIELRGVDTKTARVQALSCLTRVGLPEDAGGRLPSHLSGGEQQRVAIARTLAAQTGVLLADEPTGNLDEQNSRNILDILRGLARDEHYCVILATHDLGVLPLVDTVLRVADHRLIEN